MDYVEMFSCKLQSRGLSPTHFYASTLMIAGHKDIFASVLQKLLTETFTVLCLDCCLFIQKRNPLSCLYPYHWVTMPLRVSSQIGLHFWKWKYNFYPESHHMTMNVHNATFLKVLMDMTWRTWMSLQASKKHHYITCYIQSEGDIDIIIKGNSL